jgi:hypothetical protein
VIPTPESPIRVSVVSDMFGGGVSIYIGTRYGPQDVNALRISDDGTPRMEHLEDPFAGSGPTLKLSDEFAQALLNALTRYYQGSADLHTVRADLIHERGRVDDLIRTVSDIARMGVTGIRAETR